jgi:hypothetical protein
LRGRVAPAREDADDDRGGEGLPAGRYDGLQAILADAAQDLDHLAITIV